MKTLDFTHDCSKYNFRHLQTTEIKSYRMRLIIYRHLSQMPSFSSSLKLNTRQSLQRFGDFSRKFPLN